MTLETLTALTASLTSLLFSYIPGLRDWFGQFNGTQKRLVMIWVVSVVAIGVYGLSCSEWRSWLEYPFRCDQSGVMTLIKLLFDALVANQATYALSPRLNKNV